MGKPHHGDPTGKLVPPSGEQHSPDGDYFFTLIQAYRIYVVALTIWRVVPRNVLL